MGGLIAKDDIYVEMRQAIQNVDGITKDMAGLISSIEHGEGTGGKLLASGEFYTVRMNQVLGAVQPT